MHDIEFDPQCIIIIYTLQLKKWGLWDLSALSEAMQVPCDQARTLSQRV